MTHCHRPSQIPIPSATRVALYEPEIANCPVGLLPSNSRRAHQEVLEARKASAQPSRGAGLFEERFHSLDRLIGDYVRSVPPAAHSETDTERFMTWLEDREYVNPEQRDLLLCLYSRRAVETAALHKRLAHARFSELLVRTPALLKTLTPLSAETIRLNPVHIWAIMQTRVLLDEESDLPAHVLFYQIGDEVSTAILRGDVLPLVRMLEHRDVKVSELFRDMTFDQEDRLMDLLHQLAEMKIIAIRPR